MNNKNLYKDEFGQYHEVDEEIETPVDGFEDDEDHAEDDDELDGFDSPDDSDDDIYDEDEEYANDRKVTYEDED